MATQASTRPQKTGTRSLPRSSPLPKTATIGDLLKRLGNIPAERVRLNPTPGTATEKDVLGYAKKVLLPDAAAILTIVPRKEAKR